jgi:hypothetical protein
MAPAPAAASKVIKLDVVLMFLPGFEFDLTASAATHQIRRASELRQAREARSPRRARKLHVFLGVPASWQFAAPLSWLSGKGDSVGIKRQLPEFLAGKVSAEQYARWLERKAAAHVRRDRKRDFDGAAGAAYRDAIH